VTTSELMVTGSTSVYAQYCCIELDCSLTNWHHYYSVMMRFRLSVAVWLMQECLRRALRSAITSSAGFKMRCRCSASTLHSVADLYQWLQVTEQPQLSFGYYHKTVSICGLDVAHICSVCDVCSTQYSMHCIYDGCWHLCATAHACDSSCHI
jgi:hypothetical protein